MNILVFNSGSSSLKYRLIDSTAGSELCEGVVERIGDDQGHETHCWTGAAGILHHTDNDCRAVDHCAAFNAVRDHLHRLEQNRDLPPMQAIGHRVVHGGAVFNQPTWIDDSVMAAIERLGALAPLHNPSSLAVIRLCRENFPTLPQVAVFDTAFHQTIPEHAYRYAVPDFWYSQHQVRRYGFHGISHQAMALRAAEYLGKPLASLKLITLHLGNGASIAAIDGGHSVDTSMGMTPLEGLVMGTRSGDIDPAAVFHVGRETGLNMAQLEYQLTAQSGLAGLCGASDMREVIDRSASGDSAAHLALDMYCYRIRKYIGAYFAVLGGVDALVFSAGVGENAPLVRAMACAGLERLGIRIDADRNAAGAEGIVAIEPAGNDTAVLVIPANEELEIARQVKELLDRQNPPMPHRHPDTGI